MTKANSAAPLALLSLYTAALLALGVAAGGLDLSVLGSGYVLGTALFSLAQAAVSTALSLAGGMVLALALNRRRVFSGRALIVGLIGAAAALPAIVVVFGVLAVHGRSGLYGAVSEALGFVPQSWVFGWPGILIAHVTLNLPFAARAYLLALEAVPAETLRNAAQLRFSGLDWLRFVDWPALKRETPGLALIVFLLCFTSFPIVVTLGGGPDRSTLEAAIYTALRIEVDFSRALALILLQAAIAACFVAPFAWLTGRRTALSGPGRLPDRAETPGAFARANDALAVVLVACLILPPFLALLRHAPAIGSLWEGRIAAAALNSFVIAGLSGALSVLLALALVLSQRPVLSRLAAFAPLAVPAFGLMAGLFVLLRWFADPFGFALPVVVLINALAALPFSLLLLDAPSERARLCFARLADGLSLSGWTRFRVMMWPALRRPALAAFALAAAFSFGDYGVIAFFSGGDLVTLPLLIADRLAAYRMDEAGAIALAVVVVTIGLAMLSGRSITHAAD